MAAEEEGGNAAVSAVVAAAGRVVRLVCDEGPGESEVRYLEYSYRRRVGLWRSGSKSSCILVAMFVEKGRSVKWPK